MVSKQYLLTVLFTLLIGQSAHADWWGGLDLGAYSWNPDPSGLVGNSAIDVNEELQLNNQTQGAFWVAIEHIDTWYPSLRLDSASILLNGTGNLTEERVLRNAAFDGAVVSEVSYSTNDLAAYYQAYDNFITLDLGVAVRLVDGYVQIARQDGLLSEKASFSTFLPMLYAKTHIDMPLKGWYTDVITAGITYDRTTIIDITGKMGWKREFEHLNYSHIGLEVGYRHQKTKLHQIDNFDTDFDLGGGFLGLNIRVGF